MTARPHDRKTARPQDCMTARLQDRKTCLPVPRAFAASRMPLAASRSSALCLIAYRSFRKKQFALKKLNNY